MDDGRWIYATAIRQLKRKSLCYFLQLYFNWAHQVCKTKRSLSSTYTCRIQNIPVTNNYYTLISTECN